MVDIQIVRLVPTTQPAQHTVDNEMRTYTVERVTWRIGDQFRRTHRLGPRKLCESCNLPFTGITDA